MKLACACAVALFACTARAQEIDLANSPLVTRRPPRRDTDRGSNDAFDVRSPLRFGFAYTNITHAPEMSFSFGLAADVYRFTPDFTFQLVVDIEANSRPDLPDQDPFASFGGFGFGAGLFYLTKNDVGVGLDATLSATFDANELVGGGIGVRAYVYPFYMRFDAALKPGVDRMAAWVRSSISLWVMARTDFTSDGNGATFAFGAAFDVGRLFVLPYITALSKIH